jgi:hypothetical protein
MDYKSPQWAVKFAEAERAKRLSTKDRQFVNHFRAATALTPAEEAQGILQDIHPRNIAVLEDAISSSSDPEVIKVLKDERSRIQFLSDEVDKIRKQQQETAPSMADQVMGFLRSVFSSQSSEK